MNFLLPHGSFIILIMSMLCFFSSSGFIFFLLPHGSFTEGGEVKTLDLRYTIASFYSLMGVSYVTKTSTSIAIDLPLSTPSWEFLVFWLLCVVWLLLIFLLPHGSFEVENCG